jgi:two-component system sensor histidine kinase DesK
VAAVGGAGAAGGGAGAEPGPALGSGLAGLAERAARLGGTLSAGPGPHGGFRLAVSVPLADAGEPADPGEPAAATGSGQVSP